MPLQHDLKNWTTDEMITAEHLNQSIQAVRDIETHLNEQTDRFETKTLHATTMDISQSATITSLNAGYLARAGLRVYDTGNKPTPADIGALPASGGTVSGSLNVTGALSRAGHTVYDTGNKPSPGDIGAGLKKVASIAVNGTVTMNIRDYIPYGKWGYLHLRSSDPDVSFPTDMWLKKESGDKTSFYLHNLSRVSNMQYTQRSGLIYAYRGLSNSNEVSGLSLIGYSIINGGTAIMKCALTIHSNYVEAFTNDNLNLGGNGFLEIYMPA